MSIWNIFKKIDPQKTFDTVASGIDKAFYTKEEKAENQKELIKAQMEFYKSTLNESSARSLTRRYIACSIVGVYLILIILGVISHFFLEKDSIFIFDVVKELSTSFIVVVSFYFGSSLIRTFKDPKK